MLPLQRKPQHILDNSMLQLHVHTSSAERGGATHHVQSEPRIANSWCQAGRKTERLRTKKRGRDKQTDAEEI